MATRSRQQRAPQEPKITPASAEDVAKYTEGFALLQELEDVGHLKLGLQGQQGGGKSFTAALIAIGMTLDWGFGCPVGWFDTEKGSAFLKNKIEKETGWPLLGYRGRQMVKAIAFLEQCVEAGLQLCVFDSVTHIWQECKNSFILERNAKQKRNANDRRLSIDEIMTIKEAWAPFVDHVVNAPIHVICCGRLGFDWDYEDVDGSGELQLVKTGSKMKAETDFSYELDLVCEMTRRGKRIAPSASAAAAHENERRKGSKKRPAARAKRTVLTSTEEHVLVVKKDRFDVLDGVEIVDPKWDFFKRYTDKLTRGAHARIDIEPQTSHGMNDDGRDRHRQEKLDREILLEKIKAEMQRCYPSQTADDKKARAEVMERYFSTRSWTEIAETIGFFDLKAGWQEMSKNLGQEFPRQPRQPRGGGSDNGKGAPVETPAQGSDREEAAAS